MARESVGNVACPCCGEQADVRVQKNGRSYVMCNDPMCGFQGFTRSDHADQKLRSRMTAKAPAAAPDKKPEAPQPPAPKKGFFDGLL